MKKSYFSSLFAPIFGLIFLNLLLSCSKNEGVIPDNKPIKIDIFQAGNVSATKVTLNAELLYLNDEKVLDHGFIILDKNSSNPIKISLGAKVKTGLIKHDYQPTKAFPLNEPLYFKFYLITEKQEYLTKPSLIRVRDFWIDQEDGIRVTLGDTLVLTGNFKQITDKNKVYAHLNQPNLELINVPILKIEEKKLSLKIPDNLGLNGYPVQLYISNDQTSQAYGDELGLIIVNILGRIDFLADKPIYFGDGLKLKTFGLTSYYGDFPIIIGNTSTSYFNEIANLEDIQYTGEKLRLGYFNGYDTIFSSQKLELIKPTPAALYLEQEQFHPGNNFFITSSLLNRLYGNKELKIKLAGQIYQSYLYQNSISTSFTIPNLKAGTYDVEIVSSMFPTVKLNNKLTVKPISAKISSMAPYYFDENVELTGNFVDGIRYFAKMDQYEMEIESVKNGKGYLKLPSGLFGNQKIHIGIDVPNSGLSFQEEPININILGAVIESVSPLSAYAGDIITIKGRGLTSMGFEVFIAENQCKVVSCNANEIKFMAPALQRKGKYPFELIFFYNFSRIKSTELLELK